MSKVGKKIDKSITTESILIDGDNATISNSSGDLTINPGSGQKLVIQEQVDVDNINIDGNTISSTDTDGDINVTPDGTGEVNVGGALNVDNIKVDGNTISSTDVDGDINLTPNGTGGVVAGGSVSVDNITIDGNTISTTNTNGDLILDPNGTGKIIMNGDVELDVEDLTVNGQLFVDNLQISDNAIVATNTDGDVTITPNGTGSVVLDDISITGSELTSTASSIDVNSNLVVTGSLSGTQEDDAVAYTAPSSVALPSTYIKRLTNVDVAKEIGGITAPASDSLFFVLVNADGGELTIKNQSSSVSTAANRIITGSNDDIVLANDAALYLYYDSSVSRWRVIGGSGGADTALSNLDSTEINTSLLPDGNGSYDLGADILQWFDIYSAGTVYSNLFSNLGGGSPHLKSTDETSNNTASPPVLVSSGQADGMNSVSGNIQLKTGDSADSDSGAISLTTGLATNITANRGAVLIDAAHLDLNSLNIKNVADPVDAQDAATKNYVDSEISTIDLSGKANTTLNNLSSTAINQSLLTNGSGTVNLGAGATASNMWLGVFGRNLYAEKLHRHLAGVSTVAIDLNNYKILDNSGADSILYQNRLLRNASGTTVNYNNQTLQTAGVTKLDWSGTDIDITTRKIINVVDPTAAQDAATKNYVDNIGGSIGPEISVLKVRDGVPSWEVDFADLTKKRSDKDTGVFKTIEWFDDSMTPKLRKRSVLSGGTAPEFTTRTVTFYDTDGVTVLHTLVYALTYDIDGDLEEEVLQ